MVHGKPRFYKPTKVKQARETLIANLRIFKPRVPMDGAIELHVVWLFPKGRHRHLEWKTTKPDTDNLQKMLKDCMTETGYWNDDAQVVRETVEKVWSDEPCGIKIELIQLDRICGGNGK